MSSTEELYEQFRLAESLYASGWPADAARTLAPVVEAAPEHTAALELYARSLFASAQLGRAETALRALVAVRPDDGWAHVALARTLERQGDAAEAAVHRRVAQALGQDV